MRIALFIILTTLVPSLCFAQKNIESTLEILNEGSIAYISVDELKETKALLLDAREKNEYNVSHLPNAQWIGHKYFKIDTVLKRYPDKNIPIVVYCSIGVRSEDIGEKLVKSGYNNIKNLYGGIFEWVNNENQVVDSIGVTQRVHAYNRLWGMLLRKGQKVY